MVFEAGQIDWDSNAGRLLDRFAASLPARPQVAINVFGSAPLQLFIERTFLSEDIDLFTADDVSSELEAFVQAHRLGKGQTDLYIQICDPRAEIIRPAIERVNRAHSDFDPTLRAKLSAVKPVESSNSAGSVE